MIYLQYNLDIGIPNCGKILVEYIAGIGIHHLASLFPAFSLANIWNTYKKHYSNKEVNSNSDSNTQVILYAMFLLLWT
jgi:hypothetical protein